MFMANTTEESQQHKLSLPENNNSNYPMRNITADHQEDQYDDDEDTLSLSDLPIGQNDDSAADRNQTRIISNPINMSRTTRDMFEFSSTPNHNQQLGKVTKPPIQNSENTRFLVKQASPYHHPMGLSKSGSKTNNYPGKQRSVKKSSEDDYIFQKSKSTSLYPSRSKKHTKEGIDQHDEAEHKAVSIFSSPLKGKWLFVLLGLPPKFPTDAVQLKTDIKNRQSRHAPSTFLPFNAGDCPEEMMVPEPRPSEKRKKSMLGSCFGTKGAVQI